MYGIGEFLPKATAECKLKMLGHQAKNHANKSKKPMKEIIDMLTFGEWFLIHFRMAYLKSIAETILGIYCVREVHRSQTTI